MSKITDYVKDQQAEWDERERIHDHDQSYGQNEWTKLQAYLRDELNEKPIGHDVFLAERGQIVFGKAVASFLSPAQYVGERGNVYAIDFAQSREGFQSPQKLRQWMFRLSLTPDNDWGWKFRRQHPDSAPAMSNEELGVEIVKELVKIARSQE